MASTPIPAALASIPVLSRITLSSTLASEAMRYTPAPWLCSMMEARTVIAAGVLPYPLFAPTPVPSTSEVGEPPCCSQPGATSP
jgi:hypothetical protein